MADSITREFARWSSKLRYEDLPPDVVDKMKAVLLQGLLASAFGHEAPGMGVLTRNGTARNAAS